MTNDCSSTTSLNVSVVSSQRCFFFIETKKINFKIHFCQFQYNDLLNHVYDNRVNYTGDSSWPEQVSFSFYKMKNVAIVEY